MLDLCTSKYRKVVICCQHSKGESQSQGKHKRCVKRAPDWLTSPPASSVTKTNDTKCKSWVIISVIQGITASAGFACAPVVMC